MENVPLKILNTNTSSFPHLYNIILQTAGGREHGVPGQHHRGHCAHEAGHPQGDHARQHLQTHAHQVCFLILDDVINLSILTASSTVVQVGGGGVAAAGHMLPALL